MKKHLGFGIAVGVISILFPHMAGIALYDLLFESLGTFLEARFGVVDPAMQAFAIIAIAVVVLLVLGVSASKVLEGVVGK